MGQTQEALSHHWGMDGLAAEALESTMTAQEEERILSISESLPLADVFNRDVNRTSIGASFTRRSPKKTIINGPCSVDANTDYTELFDVIEYVADEHPEANVVVRLVGDKSRTTYGWRGLAYSLIPQERERLHEVYREGMARGIPIATEISDGQELGEFAPYLSTFWEGALGMNSTAVRSAASLFGGIPYGVKNNHSGSIQMVENAILAGLANTQMNEGSGVNIGVIAAGPHERGIPTGILPVGEGNQRAAIIARGYNIPEGTPPEIGTELALRNISDFCKLAKRLGTVVLLDKTHGAPVMIGLDRKDSDRILVVNEVIHGAIEAGEIEDSEYIGGEVAEISTTKGRTDPNHIVRWRDRERLSDMVGRVLTAA